MAAEATTTGVRDSSASRAPGMFSFFFFLTLLIIIYK